jgi:CheY-like chemotaxis protein
VPRVVALAPDLFFATKIEETLRAAGHEVQVTSTVDETLAAAEQARVVIADLHADGLDPAEFAERLDGKALLGFYSHVETEARRRGEEAGFDLVVPRSRMAREMPELVAALAARPV